MTLYGFANSGRAGSADLVRRSMEAILGALLEQRRDDEAIVLQLVEIGEGDRGYDELAIAREIFHDWHFWHTDTREPTLTLGANVRLQSVHSHRVPGTSVKHQSPARPVNQLVIDTDQGPVAVVGGHPAAGAHNGHRPVGVKALLLRSYGLFTDKLDQVTRRLRRRGCSVVKLLDTNWRAYPRRTWVTIIQRGPDFILAKAARGRRVTKSVTKFVPLFVEPKMHGLLMSRIGFPQVSQ